MSPTPSLGALRGLALPVLSSTEMENPKGHSRTRAGAIYEGLASPFTDATLSYTPNMSCTRRTSVPETGARATSCAWT